MSDDSVKADSVRVRAAREADCDEILAINAEAYPHVTTLEHRDLDRLLEIASIALVAANSSGVVGYLLAFSSRDAYDGEEFLYFGDAIELPFIFVDQVAVVAAARGHGIASRMYGHVQKRADELCILNLGSNVNLDPSNPVSMALHRKLGFESIGQLRTSEGQLVAILRKWSNVGSRQS